MLINKMIIGYKFVYRYKDYLSRGIYKCYFGKNIILEKISFCNSIAKQVYKKNRDYVIVVNPYNHGHCGVAMNTADGAIKVFDWNNGIVYTYMNSTRIIDFNRINHDMSRYFNNGLIDFKDNILAEKLLKNHLFCSEDAINRIFHDYKSYFKECHDRYYCPFRDYYLNQSEAIEYFMNCGFTNYIEKIYTSKFPIVFIHGDMHLKNLIYDQDYFYIDWNDSREDVFFYDLINIFYAEYLNGDVTLVKRYFEGQYDEALSEIFNALNVSYEKKEKGIYFVMSILSRLKSRNMKNDDVIIDGAIEILNNYCHDK